MASLACDAATVCSLRNVCISHYDVRILALFMRLALSGVDCMLIQL